MGKTVWKHVRGGLILAAALVLGASAGASAQSSGPTALASPIEMLPAGSTARPGDLFIGFVADTQIQTDAARKRVFAYRGKFEDKVISVSLRPPALDWASRSMLWSQLTRLKADGAQVVFYLGDGANNGCADEFNGDLAPVTAPSPVLTTGGILKVLDQFSQTAKVPVFYIIGNHDILGTGNTAAVATRNALCDDRSKGRTPGPNRPLSKFEVMEAVDAFNRQVAARNSKTWAYESSLPAVRDATRRQCESKRQSQRAWGCYLAARVSALNIATPVDFLLLDTNDFVDVSPSIYANFEFEGERGAMSFSKAKAGLDSQTAWFAALPTKADTVRLALSHYNVRSLTKRVVWGQAWAKSQRTMDLFVDPTTQMPRQKAAWFVSGHTHIEENQAVPTPFSVHCGSTACEGGPNWLLWELNVGSTTDYANEAALVRLTPAGPSFAAMDRRADPAGCDAVWREVARFPFPNQLKGATQGWAALGLNVWDRWTYRRYKAADYRTIAGNLNAFVGTDQRKAVCIGLKAAQVEAGKAVSLEE